MKRALLVPVAVLVAVAAAYVALVSARSGPDGPRVVVGTVAEFPVGSVRALDIEAKLTGYVPRVSDTSESEIVDVPVFLVNDPVEGLLALYASDPHLGCRVGLASELDSDTGFDLPPEVVFLNPCHGEQYGLAGRYIAGPSPRGLDRFGVVIDDGDVIVDIAAFVYGPDR